VAFTNDMMTKTEDRNLFIDGIWVETSNHQRSAVSVINPTDMMHLLASEPSAFANRFQAVRQAIHRYAPMRAGHIHVFVTEFNAMYSMNGNSPHQIRQLKSALMVDGILQRMLTEPLCQETNYWCLNSWYFQIVQMGRNGSFFYSPQGLVYRIMQPLYHGEVVRSVVQSPDFPPPHAMPIPAATKVTAVAVRNGRQLAVNLVNYDVSGTARIALRISGKFAARRSRLLLCTGPSADSENSTADPRLVHLTEQTPRITAQAVDFNLPAHSCATLILSEGAK
ncbi:MAG: hypothetical protein M1330_02950, partial [Armatimonadetes bacterium]|nr:hypothetical protein [Armatimonadota bacterium]